MNRIAEVEGWVGDHGTSRYRRRDTELFIDFAVGKYPLLAERRRASVRKGGTARHSPFAGYAKGVFIAYESSVHEVFNLLMTEGMEAEAGLPALFRNKENQEENYE